MYHYLLFDLDGTLTDSREGIVKCIEYSLTEMGEPIPNEETLLQFIGPPLVDSYMKYCGFDEEKAENAVRIYRSRYESVGLFENAVIDGVPELLRRLKARGYRTAIASSKPEKFVVPIAEKYGFAPYLDEICGSVLGANEGKSDVIRRAFSRFGIDAQQLGSTLMIGDRKYDVEGARECGIDCVGVRFVDYAPKGELEQAGALAVCDTLAQLEDFIVQH